MAPYQPDVSPDGTKVVFTRYYNDALELHLLDLSAGSVTQLTADGDVNLEPRWSPDGKQLVFTSTRKTKHFHLFRADVKGNQQENIVQLIEERRSSIPRYYYSPWDHEIGADWSADGHEIVFISNREIPYGSGALWRMKAEPGAIPVLIHREETTWKTRPDWSPDGKRIVYSSYHGRQWHQLWLLSPQPDGDAVPISFGEYDNTSPRWSPDGAKIAFISNRIRNTSLWIQEIWGGKQTQLVIRERKYQNPRGYLELTVLDPDGNPTPARVFCSGPDGRYYAPDYAWIHADDSFDRNERSFEPAYFHTEGKSTIAVPIGKILLEVLKGFEHYFRRHEVQIPAGRISHTIRLKRIDFPKNWISSDLHVHMNYTGTYRNDPKNLVFQAKAENLRIVHNLIVNKEQRIPDISYFRIDADPASTPDAILLHAQEFHTSYWGHLGLLNLKSHFLLPDFTSYPNTALASPYPTNAVVADLAREQKGLVGYVHPFDEEPEPGKTLREFPADVALGKVDYYEVTGFSDHRVSAGIWYRILNCGFRLPAGAGTDAMANFASLRGPIGLNRVYVKVDGPFSLEKWYENFRKGISFVSNGSVVAVFSKWQGSGK